MNMKGTVFQPRVLQLSLDSHTANTPTDKIGECAGVGIEPTTSCMQGRHPNH